MVQRLVQGSRGLGAVIAAIESEAEAIFEAFSHMRALRSDHQGDHGRASGQRNEPAPQGDGGQDRNRPEGGGQEGGSSQQGEKYKTKRVTVGCPLEVSLAVVCCHAMIPVKSGVARQPR